jgi:deazaflavin-dependent oxidoreductase (nitroreductase family)
MSTEPQFLYLTTTGRRSGAPREIEIWFTRHRDRYYVIAETGERAQWVQNVLREPRVTVRIGAERFPSRARVVSGESESALVRTVQQLSETKYGWGDGLVVELAPDSAGD